MSLLACTNDACIARSPLPLHPSFFQNFDRALMQLDEKFLFLASDHQMVTQADEEKKVVVAERGPLIFVFNFHVSKTYDALEIGAGEPGKYRVALDSDGFDFGGEGRVGWDVDHFTRPGGPKCSIGPYPADVRPCALTVLAPSRTVQAYVRLPDQQVLPKTEESEFES